MIQFHFSWPSLCAQQGLSDLISFTFSAQIDQKVHQQTHSNTHTHTLANTLPDTSTFVWTKAYRSHHIVPYLTQMPNMNYHLISTKQVCTNKYDY